MLNTVRQADVKAITEIELARVRLELAACREELMRQEEGWSRELAELRASQKSIIKDLEVVKSEIRGSQAAIFNAHEIITEARKALVANKLKLGESVKKREALILQREQIDQEESARSQAMEESRQWLAQRLSISGDDLRQQAQHSVAATLHRVIDEAINKLKRLEDP